MFEIMPTWFITMMVFVLGAIVGSFLNVIIYRLHTGRSINGHSHCMSCGEQLRWYELFPLFSYLALRGHCRTCHSYIPLRYALVEILTAIIFTNLLFVANDIWLLALYFVLSSVLVVTAVYDLYHLIIPNEIVVVIAMLTAVIAGYELLPIVTLYEIARIIIGAAMAYGFFAGLWLISKGRWLGLGDAKLALALSLPLSLSQVFSMIIFSFWVGALVSIVLMGIPFIFHHIQNFIKKRRSSYAADVVANHHKCFTMKSEIPFAPFLIIAFWLTYFLEFDVLRFTDYVITSII